ncbi:MAG: T9SS type A sorting domain-containing protein, partial [Ignavibacteriaceae bacterium]
AEPEYDEYYARLLWSKDTLYAFIHIDEVVNDSAGLFWDGQWLGDQLFLSLSNRLGTDLDDDSVIYDGNVYAAPDGPYHYLILGDQVTLNGEVPTYVPVEWRRCVDQSDSEKVFMASDWARWAVTIDEEAGIWNVEMAIYNPNIANKGKVGFNIGGSQGSETHDPDAGDAYMYYTWQPNIPNDPFSNPTGENDPGYYNLNNSEYWAVLNFISGPVSVEVDPVGNSIPQKFSLHQNYPNPFNPTTNIRFDVANNSPVTLKVYNVVGQMVSTLVNNQVFGAGTYSVTWDASNLASGIYFYRLEAEGVVNTMKMMLLK